MAVGANLGGIAVLDPLNPERSVTFETLAQTHNAEFNPSGQAWSPQNPNKRAAEPSGGPEVAAAELGTKVPGPLDLDKFAKVVPKGAQFDLLVDEHGSLFIQALQDATIAGDCRFCKVGGNFLLGTQAKALMSKAGAQFVPYDLTPQSRVFLTQKPLDSNSQDLQLPSSPLTLEAVFDVLAAKKQGKVELHKHKVEYQPGGGGSPMKVEVDEECCLQVTAQTAQPGQDIPVDKLASTILLSDLSALEVLHQLQYDPQLKRLKPMLPVIVPKTPILIKEGTCYKL